MIWCVRMLLLWRICQQRISLPWYLRLSWSNHFALSFLIRAKNFQQALVKKLKSQHTIAHIIWQPKMYLHIPPTGFSSHHFTWEKTIQLKISKQEMKFCPNRSKISLQLRSKGYLKPWNKNFRVWVFQRDPTDFFRHCQHNSVAC